MGGGFMETLSMATPEYLSARGLVKIFRPGPRKARKPLYRAVRVRLYEYRAGNKAGWVEHDGRFLYSVRVVLPLLRDLREAA
jgi:hypothetical protein